MKALMAVFLAAIVAAAPAAAQELVSQETDQPTIKNLVFAGSGIILPEGEDLDAIVWIEKAVIGSITQANTQSRLGVLTVTDSDGTVRYKFDNIIASDSGAVTADIYTIVTKEKVGSLSAEYLSVSGREVWKGDITLNDLTGTFIIKGHKLKDDSESGKKHWAVAVQAAKQEGACEATDSDNKCRLEYSLRNAGADAFARQYVQENCEGQADTCKDYIEDAAEDVVKRFRVVQALSDEKPIAIDADKAPSAAALQDAGIAAKMASKVGKKITVLTQKNAVSAGTGA